MALINIQKHCTNNKSEGILCVAEDNTNAVPFEIKRVYYTYGTEKEIIRGHHAHKELEQIIVAIDGSCQFVLDDGRTRETVWLNRPDIGLYIGKNMWREMRHFSYGCKLLILASTYYDEKEYIRNYDEFLKELQK